jgi:hypothetical protein
VLSGQCAGIIINFEAGATTPVSTAWSSANRAVFMAMRLDYPFNLRKFFWCNGATATGNVDCGIYSRAGTKLASTGSTAQSGTSVVQSAAPSAGAMLLAPDSYYLALAASSASATFLMGGNSVSENGGAYQDTAFALPATFTLGNAFPQFPIFGIADVGVI